MKLSENFTLEELTISETGARRGIDNTPDEPAMRNIEEYLVPGLEQVRSLLGHPILVSSGYRSPRLNAVIPGSSATSAHTRGYAADFTCPRFGDPWKCAQKIVRSEMAFDQVIYEYGAWVHLSFDPRARRLLTTKLYNQPYREGLHQS